MPREESVKRETILKTRTAANILYKEKVLKQISVMYRGKKRKDGRNEKTNKNICILK